MHRLFVQQMQLKDKLKTGYFFLNKPWWGSWSKWDKLLFADRGGGASIVETPPSRRIFFHFQAVFGKQIVK